MNIEILDVRATPQQQASPEDDIQINHRWFYRSNGWTWQQIAEKSAEGIEATKFWLAKVRRNNFKSFQVQFELVAVEPPEFLRNPISQGELKK